MIRGRKKERDPDLIDDPETYWTALQRLLERLPQCPPEPPETDGGPSI